jgi:hypothetical protein
MGNPRPLMEVLRVTLIFPAFSILWPDLPILAWFRLFGADGSVIQ